MALTIITDGARLLSDWLSAPGENRSQTLLAEIIGVSQPSVSAWLRGESRPEDHHRESIQLLTLVPRESWRKPAEQAAVDRVRIALAGQVVAPAAAPATPAPQRRHTPATPTSTAHARADRLHVDRDAEFDQRVTSVPGAR